MNPTYFLEFARANPEVSEVQLLCKRGSFRNELNTFRYDVVLRVRGKSPSAKACGSSTLGSPGLISMRGSRARRAKELDV